MPRTRKVEVFVPASPQAVEQNLKSQTRRALFPSYATVWGGGTQPFKGRVDNAKFTLAPNVRSFTKGVHSTARGELTPSGGGTRVTAEVGIAPSMVWLYRFSVIWGALVIAGVTASIVMQEPSIVLAWMALGILAIIGGTGWAVAKAEKEIDGLAAQLESAAMGAAQLEATPESSASIAEEPSLKDIMKAKRAQKLKR